MTGTHARRRRPTRAALLAMALAAVLAGLTAACGHAPASSPIPTKPPAASSPAAGKQAIRQPTAATPSAPTVALGVYTPGEAGSWAAVQSFGQQAGQPVKYVVDYLGPHDPFPAQLAQQAAASRAELVLQLEPTMNMASVAAGADDSYLDSLAAQVGDFGAPIILSWAAEANGNWYQYGWTQTPVADYQAAWAHVMARFRGDHNVTWMDTLNRWYTGAGPTSQYVVPGVGLIGIDAYYDYPDDTFASVFGQTLQQIRAVTDKPIVVNETGIGQVNNQVNAIPGLVQGVIDQHLTGLIYFNENQGTTDPYHEDWALTTAGMKALRDSLASAR